MDENLKDLEENLTWLTQKTEDPKGINGTLLSPHAHTVNVIELNCKVAYSPLPFLAKHFVPSQVSQFLEGRTPPSPLIRGALPTM